MLHVSGHRDCPIEAGKMRKAAAAAKSRDGPAEPVDGLTVAALGRLAFAQQGTDARLDAQRPLRRLRPRAFRQPLERGLDRRDLTGPGRRLGQLGHD